MAWTGMLVVFLVAAALTTERVSMNEDAAEGEVATGPAAYVDERWESEILPALTDNAADLGTVLTALETDADAANEEYGRSPGAGSAYSFPVTGTGVAGAVDGVVVPVTVDGVSGDYDVVLQVGPAITGTALRDASGLITFDDFVNQLEYQNVANELNNKVKVDPLGEIDLEAIEGSTVTFTGAFTATTTGLVSIVPVELEVE
jgi:predicted lipoprotein